MKQSITIFFIFGLLINFVSFFAENNEPIHNVIIIGSGPAGLAAALCSAQMGLSPLVITGKEIGGQLNYAPKITNWLGETAISGKDLVNRLYQHAKMAGAQFLNEEVIEVKCTQKPFMIRTNREKELFSMTMIIATGSKPKLLHIPGEEEYWGKGISTCALCDGMLYKHKQVAIIGNGNMALYNALHMTDIAEHIFIVTEKKQLSGTKQLQKSITSHPKCTLLLGCKPIELHGTQESGIMQLSYFDTHRKQEKTIAIDGVFISIGSVPNIDLFAGQLDMDDDQKFPKTIEMVHTSIPGIFIAMPKKYQQAMIGAGLGFMAALSANQYLKNQTKDTKKRD